MKFNKKKIVKKKFLILLFIKLKLKLMALLSFVIPAYNEQDNIYPVFEKINELMKNLPHYNYEIIFINDGSYDNTFEVLKKLTLESKNVKVLNFSRNFGQQIALWAGLNYSTGEAIISLDCDLQDPPEIILNLIQKWTEGFDIVYARRKNRHDSFFKKYTAIWYYKLLDKFSDVKIPRNVGDFRLMSQRALNELLKMKEKAIYLRGMASWLGFNHAFVDFDRPERIHGKTQYTLKKMIRLAMDGFLNFSLLPLKIGFLLGIISIFIGIIFLGYMVYDTVFNDAIYQLIKWLVVILFIFIGFLFILIWILGEYIGRIYEESKDRPRFIIKDKFNFDEKSNI